MPFRVCDPSTSKEIQSKRGPKLYARYWTVEEPRGLVFLSHGFSEHLNNYHNIAEGLVKSQLFVFGHDHIGHGKSDGTRAYVDSADEYVDDLIHHCQMICEEYKDLPLFVLGHSMGGMVALRAALRHPSLFQGLILMGPLIIPGPSIGPIDFRVTSYIAPFAKVFLNFLDFFNPQLVLGSLNRNLVTRDKDVQKLMAEDDLRWHGGCKVRLLLAFVQCLEDNFGMMDGLKVPFLTLHGTADGLCNIIGSRMLMQRAIVEDKTIIEFEGAMHQLYMELPDIREKAIQATVKWIDGRC